MASGSVHPVILCGGAGERLWPASGPARPKPFLALTGGATLLQETALRLAAIAGARPPILVVAAVHQALAAEQMAAIGLAHGLITEPGGRGSGPAIAAAALEIAATESAGVVLAVASDHHLPDAEAFAAGVAAALAAAENGALVSFGVKPTSASSAYGYLQPGRRLDGEVRASARFIEKPDADAAAALVEAGWLWNSGNFLFRADIMLDELRAGAPGLLEAVGKARDGGVRDGAVMALGPAFLEAPNIAIDVAVMERTARGAVLGVDYAWSDLGTWEAVLAAAPRDGSGNAVQAATAVVADSEGCLIRARPGTRIVAVGLKNIAVVIEGDRILVCDLAAAQSIRPAVAAVEGQ
jgi:mannose-1-phosphate guanylyltransferase/mannose-6-phosphate isomerase